MQRLTVANRPNIFQMLLVIIIIIKNVHYYGDTIVKTKCVSARKSRDGRGRCEFMTEGDERWYVMYFQFCG